MYWKFSKCEKCRKSQSPKTKKHRLPRERNLCLQFTESIRYHFFAVFSNASVLS